MESETTLQSLVAVFVYGTLRANASNHHRLRASEFIANLKLPGRLYAVDWYPGMVYDINSPFSVIGEVYHVSEDTLRELDEYEGAEYKRISLKVDELGESPDVSIWQYCRPHGHLALIEHGDWLEYLAEKNETGGSMGKGI